MNLRQITEAWLKEDGYDGLYSTGIECGCHIGDLMPCDEPDPEHCEPGYQSPCPGPEDCENAAAGTGCGPHMGPKKGGE